MFLEVNKTDEEITADILKEVPAKYQKSVGFFAWDYARALAIGGFNKVYSILKYVCSLGDINNFEYDDLVKFVKQRRGIIAHEETHAIGSLTAKGNGTIKVGDLFQTESGLKFESLEEITIVESGTFAIQCVEAGSVGNVPENSIVIIPVSIAGIASVTNESATTGGYDKETKESIIERYMEDVQQPITSNNKYHYKKWAKEVAGVGDAIVKPTWDGNNTVKIVIINAEKEVADNALVNEVQKYIDPYGYKVTNGDLIGYVQNFNEDFVKVGEKVYSDYDLKTVIKTAGSEEFSYLSAVKYGWGYGNGQASVGAYTTVESAVKKEINVEAQIILKSGVVFENIKESIKDAVKEYLKSTVFADSYISYTQIGACFLKVDGVLDYDKNSFKLNGAEDNVVLTDSDEKVEIAVLNEFNVTEKG